MWEQDIMAIHHAGWFWVQQGMSEGRSKQRRFESKLGRFESNLRGFRWRVWEFSKLGVLSWSSLIVDKAWERKFKDVVLEPGLEINWSWATSCFWSANILLYMIKAHVHLIKGWARMISKSGEWGKAWLCFSTLSAFRCRFVLAKECARMRGKHLISARLSRWWH